MRKNTTLGNRTISYLEADGGAADPGRPTRTLLWLHAFPLSAEMWQPQLAAVPRGWRAIAPDFPGFGGTDPLRPGTAPTLDEFAADVIDLAQALHLEHPVVGGLSMGGYAAFALFRHAPHLFGGIILADTRASADTEQGRAGRQTMIALAEREGPGAVAENMLPKALGETTRREQPHVVERVRALMAAQTVNAITTASRAMMARPDSTPQLPSIHCPALVIVGREDQLTPLAESEKLAEGISGSTLAVIERAGHLSNLEQPEAFTHAVDAFLTRRV